MTSDINTNDAGTGDIIVDAHLDMAYNAVVLGRDLLRPLSDIRTQEEENSPRGAHHGTSLVSLPELLKGRVAVVGGSLFVAPAFKAWQQEPQVYRTPDQAYRYAIAQLDYYRRLADENNRVHLLHVERDLDEVLVSWKRTPAASENQDKTEDDQQIGLFLVMEGADPIREPGELAWWVERGLRGVGLTWSAGTRYAGGTAAPGGISDEGVKLLAAMADYNLMLDVSHMWVDAVYEALGRYPGPIVATHANPRAFVDSPRLLSDDVIRRIADRGGVVGMVPYNPMLKPGWRIGEPRLPLGRLVEAIDHVCQVTGQAGCVGLGSDFDGGFGRESVPEGVDSIADLKKIGELLRERGYSPSDIMAFLSGNWLRVMRTVLHSL